MNSGISTSNRIGLREILTPEFACLGVVGATTVWASIRAPQLAQILIPAFAAIALVASVWVRRRLMAAWTVFAAGLLVQIGATAAVLSNGGLLDLSDPLGEIGFGQAAFFSMMVFTGNGSADFTLATEFRSLVAGHAFAGFAFLVSGVGLSAMSFRRTVTPATALPAASPAVEPQPKDIEPASPAEETDEDVPVLHVAGSTKIHTSTVFSRFVDVDTDTDAVVDLIDDSSESNPPMPSRSSVAPLGGRGA